MVWCRYNTVRPLSFCNYCWRLLTLGRSDFAISFCMCEYLIRFSHFFYWHKAVPRQDEGACCEAKWGFGENSGVNCLEGGNIRLYICHIKVFAFKDEIVFVVLMCNILFFNSDHNFEFGITKLN